MTWGAKIETLKRQPDRSVRAAVAATVFSTGFWMCLMALCALALLAAQPAAAQTTQEQDVWKQAGADDSLRQAFERALYGLEDSGHGQWRGSNDAQRLSIEFDSQGARLRHPLGSAGIHLAGLGYGDALEAPAAPKLTADGARLEYRRGDLTEWYVNSRQGLEQGFTLQHKPGGAAKDQPLTIALDVTGELELSQQDGAILLKSGKTAVLRYAGLTAIDARGRTLPARMEARKGQIRVTVEDQDAEYPLTVDPTWTQQQELTASDGKAEDNFGYSVSVSGTTAVIGAFEHTSGTKTNAGAAYVFVENGGAWSLQQELTASDGVAYDSFGSAVSVSGTTAVIGAINHAVNSYGQAGAAYVFVQSGSTWSQQAELTASDYGTADWFGFSVSVSGATAVIGAPDHTVGAILQAGAAYVFVQSGSTWSQQAELTASDDEAGDGFGTSVSVDGTKAVIGANGHTVGSNSFAGAAYVFVQNGSTWSQQEELTASDNEANDNFGNEVSVSGTTAVIAAPSHKVGSNSQAGAAYVFVQSGSTWSQQQELTASDGAASDQFGYSVSVSGTTAVIAAPYHTVGSNSQAGAAYLFVESGGDWSQQQELTASNGEAGDNFGISVSVSGTTAVIGAPYHPVGSESYAGAAYVFAPATGTRTAQTIDFTPITGEQYALSDLTLKATASSGLTVSFASTTPSVCTVSGATASLLTEGTCTIQATQAGNSDYAAATMVSQSFTVNGETQTITFGAIATQTVGTPLTLSATASSGLAVSFTSTTTSVCTVSGTTATFVASGTCTIDANQAGNSAYAAAPQLQQSFTVNNPFPVIAGISPAFTSAGGAAFTLTVTGSGFVSGSTVYWGTSALTTTYGSTTQLTAQVPAADIATAGTTAITVQTPSPGGGTSKAFQFEVDSASGSTTGPTFTSSTATVTAGSSASFPATLPSTVESVSVTCLNLPSGASCSYSSTTSTLTIATSSTTPAGTYQITVVFTETVSGAATSWILLPILLLPLVFLRRKLALRGVWVTACLWLVLLAGAAVTCVGCGGGGGGSSTPPPPQTHQVVSSGTVTLTVQ
jgi:hypothetical protein